MTHRPRHPLLTYLLLLLCLAPPGGPSADPCGMVLPRRLAAGNSDGDLLRRIGVQTTYAFHAGGIESLVLRPAFEGRASEFGMLIPFPSPPSVRKVSEDIFSHLAAAAEPPEVEVFPSLIQGLSAEEVGRLGALGYSGGPTSKPAVTVLREEAVGTYHVAVLEAGSAGVLRAWLEDHDFRFPEGMDAVCDEYIEADWCFVAVKARIGRGPASEARPGMREVDNGLRADDSFDGHVQAMGFRFRSEELVVPMRLSAYNPGDTRNLVYLLTEGPVRFAELSEEHVVRQIPGRDLIRNLVVRRPLRIHDYPSPDPALFRHHDGDRAPGPVNGFAAALFAGDLQAASTNTLSSPVEEILEDLAEISEELDLRGAAMDALHRGAAGSEVETEPLRALSDMTLTILDGVFEREILAATDLHASPYTMDATANLRESYDPTVLGPPPTLGGTRIEVRRVPGAEGAGPQDAGLARRLRTGIPVLLGVLALILFLRSRRRARRGRPPLALGGFLLLPGLVLFGTNPGAPVGSEDVSELTARVRTPDLRAAGAAVLALRDVPGPRATGALRTLAEGELPELVSIWCRAALVQRAVHPEAMLEQTRGLDRFPLLASTVAARWRVLLADGRVDFGNLLQALRQQRSLEDELAPLLRGSSMTDSLVRALFSEGTDEARRFVASYLAAVGDEDPDRVWPGILEALRFRPAEVPPWEGGGLFLPRASGSDESLEALVTELALWGLALELSHDSRGEAQVDRVLRSPPLMGRVGYGVAMPPSAVEWVRVLERDAFDRAWRDRLIARLDLPDDSRAAVVARISSD